MFNQIYNFIIPLISSLDFWFVVVLILFTATIIFIFYWRRNNPYIIGYRRGKKVAKAMKTQLNSILNKDDSSDFDEKIKEINKKAFETAFSLEIENFKHRINHINQEIENLKSRKNKKEEQLRNELLERKKKIEREIEKRKKEVKNKEEELLKFEHKEAELMDKKRNNYKLGKYTSSKVINKLKKYLSEISNRWEEDIKKIIYTLAFLALLAGDFYITLSIFKDVLGVSGVSDIFIYIGSGIIALVFLMFFDFVLEKLESKSKKIQKEAEKNIGLIVGSVLLVAYLLIISVSLLPSIGGIVDTILRVLFVPLIIVAAFMLNKIKNDYGFDFILTPFKFLFSLLSLIFFYLILPFEAFIKWVIKKNELKSRTSHNLSKKHKEFTKANKKLTNKKQKLNILENSISKKLTMLEAKFSKKIEELKEEKRSEKEKMQQLKRGSSEAVFLVLQKD